MTLSEALRSARETLASNNIGDARLEAEILLMNLLGLDRASLYLRTGEELSRQQMEACEYLVKRRLYGEPTAYIVGHREFFGIDFYIDPRAIIPRPETELLVEKALEWVEGQWPSRHPIILADVGTGSGAIAISLALNLPQAAIYATDSSAEALEVAAINCERHGVGDRVRLLHGDLLGPLPEPVDIIVANLPYVKSDELSQLSVEIRDYEPLVALNGGDDGLDLIRRLLMQAGDKLRSGGSVLLEIGHGEGQAARKLAEVHFPDARVDMFPDLAGIDRVLSIRLGVDGRN